MGMGTKYIDTCTVNPDDWGHHPAASNVVDVLPDPKPCPSCGKLMLIVSTGALRASNPVQSQYEWFCGCGHRERGPWLREKTADQLCMEAWRKLNGLE